MTRPLATAARAHVLAKQSPSPSSSPSSHSLSLSWACLLIGCRRSSACVRKQCFLLRRPPSPSRLLFFLRPRYLYGPSLPAALLPPSPERSPLYCTLGWVIRGSRNGERKRQLCGGGEEDHLFFNDEGRDSRGRKKEAHRRRGGRGGLKSRRQT